VEKSTGFGGKFFFLTLPDIGMGSRPVQIGWNWDVTHEMFVGEDLGS
jgi:hypothetical protein